MRQEGEASVEEILESIKKVIARDNRAGAVIERQKRENRGVADGLPDADDSDDETDILDLGSAELVEDDISDENGDDWEASHNSAAEDNFDSDDDDDSTPLTTEPSRDSMRENLAALAMMAAPGASPQIVRSGETSLEGLTRELLRPMLAEWLDTNLPGMVEKMVRDEIARIAGKKS